MTTGSDTLYFAYDASGPMSVTCNGKIFYYVKNLQGDVTAILDSNGAAAATYSYDAWGKVLSIGGYMAGTLGTLNPLRYRGYVYDQEIGLYYLQTRYYNPTVGRFISADAFVATGQGQLGNNMFAYCNNNPVRYEDPNGELLGEALIFIGGSTLIGAAIGAFSAACKGEDVLSGAMTGAAIGAVSSAVVFGAAVFDIPNLAAATAAGILGGAVDAAIQYTSTGTVDLQKVATTAATTFISAAVPVFDGINSNMVDAVGSLITSSEVSTLVTVVEVSINKFASARNGRWGNNWRLMDE